MPSAHKHMDRQQRAGKEPARQFLPRLCGPKLGCLGCCTLFDSTVQIRCTNLAEACAARTLLGPNNVRLAVRLAVWLVWKRLILEAVGSCLGIKPMASCFPSRPIHRRSAYREALSLFGRSCIFSNPVLVDFTLPEPILVRLVHRSWQNQTALTENTPRASSTYLGTEQFNLVCDLHGLPSPYKSFPRRG